MSKSTERRFPTWQWKIPHRSKPSLKRPKRACEDKEFSVISLEQVQQLDTRVKKAVSTIKTLNLENANLKEQIAELEIQLESVQKEISSRKVDEEQIEEGLQGVLNLLEEVDDKPSEHNEYEAANEEESNSSSHSSQESHFSEDEMDAEESLDSGSIPPDDNEAVESAAEGMESPGVQENSDDVRLDGDGEEAPSDDPTSQSEFDIF